MKATMNQTALDQNNLINPIDRAIEATQYYMTVGVYQDFPDPEYKDIDEISEVFFKRASLKKQLKTTLSELNTLNISNKETYSITCDEISKITTNQHNPNSKVITYEDIKFVYEIVKSIQSPLLSDLAKITNPYNLELEIHFLRQRIDLINSLIFTGIDSSISIDPKDPGIINYTPGLIFTKDRLITHLLNIVKYDNPIKRIEQYIKPIVTKKEDSYNVQIATTNGNITTPVQIKDHVYSISKSSPIDHDPDKQSDETDQNLEMSQFEVPAKDQLRLLKMILTYGKIPLSFIDTMYNFDDRPAPDMHNISFLIIATNQILNNWGVEIKLTKTLGTGEDILVLKQANNITPFVHPDSFNNPKRIEEPKRPKKSHGPSISRIKL